MSPGPAGEAGPPPLRLGLLGTARINLRVLEALAGTRAVEAVAVASRDRGRAAAYAREHGVAAAFGSYEAMLADDGVDAVYVGLPNTLHLPWVERSLEAGKHVLCEKPLGLDPDRVGAAFDLAERRGLVLVEGFAYRHHPQTELLLSLLAGGAIGAPRLLRGLFGFTVDQPQNIRLRPELGGGALLDVGCYIVHAARLLLGEPREVAATVLRGPTGVDSLALGSLLFGGGAAAQFTVGIALPRRVELELVGSGGSLLLPDPFHCREPGILLRSAGEERRLEVEPANAFRLQFEHLAALAAGTSPPLLGRSDAVAQAATLLALVEAAGAPAAG